MDQDTPGARWRRGAWVALAIGPIAGAAEVGLSLMGGASGAGIGARAALITLAALTNGVAAAALAFLLGFVHRSQADEPAWRPIGLQIGLASTALAAAHLVPLALAHDAVGESTVALAAIAQVPIIGALATFAARILLSRAGEGSPLPGFAGVGVIAFGCAMAASTRPSLPPAGPSTAGVLLVTVDALGARDGLGETDTLRALAPHAFHFSAAVAPSSSVVANAATVTSGVHPLQHHALTDLHAMRPGVRGLAAPFGGLGLPAVAVIGDRRLAHDAALDGGFTLWLDDLAAPIPGFDRLHLTKRLLGPWLRAPSRASDAAVVDAALQERAALDAGGLLWVHLAGARAPWGDAALPDRGAPPEAWAEATRAARDARARTDAELGRLLTALGAMDGHRAVIVAGLRGVSVGQHGLGPDDPSLWDEAVVVPIYLTGPKVPPTGRSDAQVALQDIAPTVYALLDLAPPRLDGVDLIAQLRPETPRPEWTPLYSETLDQTPLVGLRTDDVKATLDVRSDALKLYDLTQDPAETTDIFAQQPELAAKVGGLLHGVSKRVLAIAPTRTEAE